MKNRAIEYPHPVLNEYTNDFTNCDFSIEVVSQGDSGDNLNIELNYHLKSDGIFDLLSKGIAKIVLRLTCFRTSYRKVFYMNTNNTTLITIEKKNVTDVIDLQASIVATQDYKDYSLEDFNTNYFGTMVFYLRKGDIIANEPGIKIKLNTVLEKNMTGVVQVSHAEIPEMRVHYASIEETDPALTNYIIITLPETEYKSYSNLTKKKHLKKEIDRFLQCSIVLPAITEAVSKLRIEEELDDSELEQHYSGTVWAESIKEALLNLGIDDLSASTESDFSIANRLLGNVVSDSINNLMQKMIEWSTIRQEDDVL